MILKLRLKFSDVVYQPGLIKKLIIIMLAIFVAAITTSFGFGIKEAHGSGSGHEHGTPVAPETPVIPPVTPGASVEGAAPVVPVTPVTPVVPVVPVVAAEERVCFQLKDDGTFKNIDEAVKALKADADSMKLKQATAETRLTSLEEWRTRMNEKMEKVEKTLAEAQEIMSTLIIGVQTHVGLFDKLSPELLEKFHQNFIAPKLLEAGRNWESLKQRLLQKKEQQAQLDSRISRLERQQNDFGVDKVQNQKEIDTAKKDLEGLIKDVESLEQESIKVEKDVMMFGAVHRAFSMRLNKPLPVEAGVDGQETESEHRDHGARADDETEGPVPQVIKDYEEVRRLLREGNKEESTHESFKPAGSSSERGGRRGRGTVRSNSTADLIDY